MTKTDEIVIEEVLAGDRNAYSVLVERYKDKVFSLVFRILKDYELTQEVAQDIFVKAYISLKKFRKDSSFSTWIYRISYNSAISETRKRKVKNFSFDDSLLIGLSRMESEESSEGLRMEEDQKKLNSAINELLPEEKAIINLYYFEEKAISEISEITGLGQSNVKVKLHRLRKKLKELISGVNKKELALF